MNNGHKNESEIKINM